MHSGAHQSKLDIISQADGDAVALLDAQPAKPIRQCIALEV
jgi:hypothetical protein